MSTVGNKSAKTKQMVCLCDFIFGIIIFRCHPAKNSREFGSVFSHEKKLLFYLYTIDPFLAWVKYFL
jgi:hypothetical protein